MQNIKLLGLRAALIAFTSTISYAVVQLLQVAGVITFPLDEEMGEDFIFGNAMITPLIAVVYFYPNYSEKLLVLGYPWGVTAPLAMFMLALFFKK
jgi:hypothetical protein